MTDDAVRLTRSQDRVGALAQTFGRAFVNEPMMRWPLGVKEGSDVAALFARCFGYFLEAAIPLGLIWATDDDWDPPTHPSPTGAAALAQSAWHSTRPARSTPLLRAHAGGPLQCFLAC